jgi:hypothetical protein
MGNEWSAIPDSRVATRRGLLKCNVASPEAPADLAVVDFEPLQIAVALNGAHGILRKPQSLGNRSGVNERHEAWPAGRR